MRGKSLFALLVLLATSGVHAAERWVDTWGAAQMIPDGQNELPAAQWQDASLRQIVHTSVGGDALRVRISNVFGTAPLVVDAASVARALQPGRAEVDGASLHPLLFAGRGRVTIPAGAEYDSDPVDLSVAPGADLAVSLHFQAAPARQTGHPGARATGFVTRGDHVLDASWPNADKITRWYQISAIAVRHEGDAHAVVAIGDSITDGHGATTDGNDRWPDLLAARLRASGMADIGVVNAGIGGGRVLRDGLGPNLMSRFERDVLARTGVSHAIVLIGVNDLGIMHRNGEDTPQARKQLVDDLTAGWRQLVERAHAHGVCVVGATITPFAGSGYYHPEATNEADRQAINHWIRSSGVFDAVADFDAAVRDGAAPDHLRKEFDTDGLHPSPAGFKEMAQAVPLPALAACRYAR